MSTEMTEAQEIGLRQRLVEAITNALQPELKTMDWMTAMNLIDDAGRLVWRPIRLQANTARLAAAVAKLPANFRDIIRLAENNNGDAYAWARKSELEPLLLLLGCERELVGKERVLRNKGLSAAVYRRGDRMDVDLPGLRALLRDYQ